MDENNRKTFVIKSDIPQRETTAPATDTDDSPPPRRKLFEIKSVAPQVELPDKAHSTVNVTEGVAADQNPRSGDTCILYLTKSAFGRIEEHTGWGRHTADNAVEQGGLLLGHAYHDPEQKLIFGIARNAIPGIKARGSGAYLDMTHETWADMLVQVDAIIDANPDSGLRVIGWYHTHPNALDVFMSGTDRNTQRTFFSHEWQFAVVLNPHKQLWRVYRGSESVQCLGFLTEDVTDATKLTGTPRDTLSPARPVGTVGGDKPRVSVWTTPVAAWPGNILRAVLLALIIYSILATFLALRLRIKANRLGRQKLRAETALTVQQRLGKTTIGPLDLQFLPKTLRESRNQLAAKHVQDKSLLAEIERAAVALLEEVRVIIEEGAAGNVTPIPTQPPVATTIAPTELSASPSPAPSS